MTGARCTAAAEKPPENIDNESDTVFAKDNRNAGEKRTIWNDIEMGGMGRCQCVCVEGCTLYTRQVVGGRGGGAQLFLGTKSQTVAAGVGFVDGWA